MYRLVCLAFLLLSTQATIIFAQKNYDIRLQLKSADCDAKKACYNVQIRSSNGSTWELGGQNYRLYYDASLANFDSGSSQLGGAYQPFDLVQNLHGLNATGYGGLNFESTLGFLNFSVDMNNISTGGTSVDGNWLTTTEVCFEMETAAVTDPSSCFELVWAREGVTNNYTTSFVQVSEWVQSNVLTAAEGSTYQDIVSSGANSCLATECSSNTSTGGGTGDSDPTGSPAANVANGLFDIQFALDDVDCASNQVCYNVQLKSNGGNDFILAGQNYRIYYDGALGSYTSGTSLLSSQYGNFTLVQDVQNLNASGAGSLSFESDLSFLNYSIDLQDITSGGVLTDGNWLTTSQLCFTVSQTVIDDPNTCFEAIWSRDGLTNSYATSFVEVSEWVGANNTDQISGVVYNDLTSASPSASCLQNACSSNQTNPSGPVAGGVFDIQLTLGDVNCASNQVCYNVQLKSNGGNDFNLAGQNYRLYYDGSIGSYVSGISLLPSGYGSYTLIQDIQNQNAGGAGNLNFDSNLSFLNYTIDLENTTTGGIMTNGNWQTTSQLCFEMTPAAFSDPNTCFEAVWSRDGLTNSYATSFVEVSEWTSTNNTEEITGVLYNDLTAADGQAACLNDLCADNTDGQFDIQLTLNNSDCATGVACYDVQVRADAATNLAGQNYRLYYDATLGAYTGGVSFLPTADYTGFNLIQDIQNQNATGIGNLPFESTLSFLNYTIDLSDLNNGGVAMDQNWLTTSQLCFSLEREVFEDPNICFEAVWARDGLTNEYATSFVEVSEWITTNDVEELSGNNHIDLDTSNPDACPPNDCAAPPNFGVQLTPNVCDCDSKTVCYEVEIRSTDGNAFNLAGQNYRLYYDASLAKFRSGNSTLTSDYSTFQLEQDLHNVNAAGTGSIPFESTLGFLNYYMDLENLQNGGITIPGDGSWITTSLLCFDVEEELLDDASVCFDALWGRMGVTDEYATSFVEVAEWVMANQTIQSIGTEHIDLTENACFVEKAAVTTTLNQTICEGDSYSFDNQTLTTAGTYSATFDGAVACDSTVILELTVVPDGNVVLNETICQGEIYSFNGQDYTSSGTYTITDDTGTCSSTTTLNLTVIDSEDAIQNETICEGESYTINGQTFTAAGSYSISITGASDLYLCWFLYDFYKLYQWLYRYDDIKPNSIGRRDDYGQ